MPGLGEGAVAVLGCSWGFSCPVAWSFSLLSWFDFVLPSAVFRFSLVPARSRSRFYFYVPIRLVGIFEHRLNFGRRRRSRRYRRVSLLVSVHVRGH